MLLCYYDRSSAPSLLRIALGVFPLQLATSAIIFSTVMAVLLYLVSFDKGTTLAAGGDTGEKVLLAAGFYE